METEIIKTECISISDVVIEDEEQPAPEKAPRLVHKSDRMLRCHRWVESQRNVVYSDYEESDDNSSKSGSFAELDGETSQSKSNKRKKIDDDSDDPITERDYHPNKQRKRDPIKNLVIHHDCEWMGCRYTTMDYDAFKNHVKSHMHELLVKTSEDGLQSYVCLWDICRFETPDSKMIIRHVNYHSYDTRVKSIGKNVRERLTLPSCRIDSRKRNQLPKLEFDFSCRWIDCTLTFCAIQDYFDHVTCHVQGTLANSSGKFGCLWFGCSKVFNTITKLGYHLKSHSEEKVVGCANCGAKFRTNYSYADHCEKQLPVKEKGFHCDVCDKVFLKERFLMSHARKHINSYKCTFCDMTTNSPSSLGLHIRYRHLNYRPFKCHLCGTATVTKNDLQTHLRSHTVARKKYVSKTYICHCCDKPFSRGPYLSKHLLSVHGYSLPNGYSRFKYKLSEDGAYRLNPLRFESVVEMGQGHKNKNIDNDKTDYHVMQWSDATDNKPAAFVVLPLTDDKLTIEEMMATHNETKDKEKNDNDKKIAEAALKILKDKKYKRKGRRKKTVDKTIDLKCEVASSQDILSSIKDIDDFSCIKRFKRKPEVKSVEISIAEVDLHGNITSEVVESQEILI